jgi:GAF domain-containing protein
MLSTDGHVLRLNRAGREMAEISPDEDVRQYLISDLHPRGALTTIIGEGIPAAMRDGVWLGNTALLTRSGREVPVSQLIIAPRSPSGAVETLSTILRDCSERVQREEDDSFLLEASRILSASLVEDQILTSLARLVVAERAEVCLIDRLDENGAFRPTIAEHRDAESRALLHALTSRFKPVSGKSSGPNAVLQTGTHELVSEITEKWIAETAVSEAHRLLLTRLGIHAQLSVPLRMRNHNLGAITLVRTSETRRFQREDVRVLEELARETAVAIENCRLHLESQHAIATRDRLLMIAAHDLRNRLWIIHFATDTVLLALPESMMMERRQLELVGRSVEVCDRLIDNMTIDGRRGPGTVTPPAVRRDL